MTLDEFKRQYLNKYVDFDGVYNYQCVDLIKFYNRDVVKAPPIQGNAKDYIRNPLPSHYILNANTPLYIPPYGSIAIWNGNVGKGFGHVSIVLTAKLFTFESLDQNWPEGAVVSIVKHNYKNVEGFLVPRGFDLGGSYNQLVMELRGLVNKYGLVQ